MMKRRPHLLPLLGTLLCILAATGCGPSRLTVADSQMERGEFHDASRSYRKVYNKLTKPEDRTLRAEVAFKLATAHARLGQHARAAGAYRNALRYGHPDSLLYRRLAESLHADGKYTAASDAYRQHLMLHPEDGRALTGLRGAEAALEMREHPTRYKVAQAKLFNTRRSDYAPVLQGDALYLTTSNEKATGNSHSEVTGTKRPDIWVAAKDEQGRWQRPEPLKGALNTDADEGVVSFSADGRTMYLTRAVRRPDADTRLEIVTSARSDAEWGEARALDLWEDTTANYAHPSPDPAGKYLYFTSDRAGTHGSYDLWRIRLDSPAGSFPENLGAEINTPGRELFPCAVSDSVLYFASDGHPGMGGLDIFRAVLTPAGVWQTTNMGYPINSSGDDFGITFERGREAGFFSSNRGDARGYDHIYSFVLPDLNITISGYVTDLEEEPIAGALIRIVGRDGSNRRAVSRDDGSFSFSLERGVSYQMLATAKGYMNARQEFATDTAEADAEYGVDFMLASLTAPNIVENIFYDYDKATLRPESAAALDSLATLLLENPAVTVEMASHTDRIGSDTYNNGLSERRARAVVDYLIGAGVPAERLTWRGYGKTVPKVITKRLARLYPQFPEGQRLDEDYVSSLDEQNRAAADQINRRTEFTVTSTDFELPL